MVRAGVIDPKRRQRRQEHFKRWERAIPMDLWQLDVVGGFHLADGSTAKALTGIDDHSRYCVSARLMHRERTSKVCEGFRSVLRKHGTPDQVLTDNGKVFTGRLFQPPVEVLFEACEPLRGHGGRPPRIPRLRPSERNPRPKDS